MSSHKINVIFGHFINIGESENTIKSEREREEFDFLRKPQFISPLLEKKKKKRSRRAKKMQRRILFSLKKNYQSFMLLITSHEISLMVIS